MKAKIYVETTIVSYLTAKRAGTLLLRHTSKSLKNGGRPTPDFDLFISELVIREAGDGDEAAAKSA